MRLEPNGFGNFLAALIYLRVRAIHRTEYSRSNDTAAMKLGVDPAISAMSVSFGEQTTT